MSELVLFARYTPPGWGDPIEECRGGHDWGYWRSHPNGVNDVRTCRRDRCSWSDWRDAQSAPRWGDR